MRLKTGRRRVPRAVRVEFWELVRAGVWWRRAAAGCGVPHQTAQVWLVQAGGVKGNGTRPVGRRYLDVADREEIALGLAAGDLLRAIGARIGRPASTVCREVAQEPHQPGGRYRALGAQAAAEERARRPKVAKLAADPVLRDQVQHWLGEQQWSPQQIPGGCSSPRPPEDAGVPRDHLPVLYVQGRGALRQSCPVLLRSGRALRKPSRGGRRRTRAGIAKHGDDHRPSPEVEDRAVPGHWEGDLIFGKNSTSAIGTLVDAHPLLPAAAPARRPTAPRSRKAMINRILTLPAPPAPLADLGPGQGDGRTRQITIATGLHIYFCDPHHPGSGAATRTPTGCCASTSPKAATWPCTQPRAHLMMRPPSNSTAAPAKPLDWGTPAEALNHLSVQPASTTGVATTP